MKHLSILLIALALFPGACQFGDIDIAVSFDRVSGLARGDRVLFQGNPAGSVTDVVYQSDNTYEVTLAVDKGYSHALTEYSQFYLVSDPTQNRSDRKAVEIRLSKPGGKTLADGARMKGVSEPEDLFSKLQRDLAAGMEMLQKQIDKFSRDMNEIPESEEYRQLKKSLEAWSREMEQAGDKARKKVEKQWLPKIEEQFEALKKWLREQGREDEIEPLEREFERIRKI